MFVYIYKTPEEEEIISANLTPQIPIFHMDMSRL